MAAATSPSPLELRLARAGREVRAVTAFELGLRGVMILVDHPGDDAFSADGSKVDHVPDGLRFHVRGRCRRDWCGLWPKW